jgi:hypothetical protein
VDTRVTESAGLRERLATRRQPDHGWGYYDGRTSRLEPTCWALLALGGTEADRGRFLRACQQPSGWLVEHRGWPVNVGFNALAAVTWLADSSLASDAELERLLAALVGTKGITAQPSRYLRQDNSLQGWPWIDQTFSWVEPTSWGLLALKKAHRRFEPDRQGRDRVAAGEQLLVDRCCRDGGWNYGNASVMDRDLRPHGPTTALALLALQDMRSHPAVSRSLAYLEGHWADEPSAAALGLALLALDVHGRPLAPVRARLEEVVRAPSLGNVHAAAIALVALTRTGSGNVFRL